MHPETQLAIVAALAGFLLKTSFGFCICWAVSKTAVAPRRRFLIWFACLSGAGLYWLWVLAGFVAAGLPAVASHPAAQQALSGSPEGRLQLAAAWAVPISIVLRGLGFAYAAALGYFLFGRIKKHRQLRWILQFAYEAPETVESVFRPVARELDAGDVRLLMLSGIDSPATFGWLKPTVLVPPLCLEQDESELADIFRHELQHVRRRDFALNAVSSFCRAILFFHPAAWYAMRKIRLESELACDQAVVGDSPERRASYAECLVRFARLRITQESATWGLDFAGSSVQLKVRVSSMLDGAAKVPGWMLGLRTAAGLALFAGFVCTAPSLFVVLSYARQPVAEMLPSVAPGPQARSRKHAPDRMLKLNAGLKGQQAGGVVGPLPADGASKAPVETANVASPAMPGSDMPGAAGRLSSTGSDPTLKRRGEFTASGLAKPAPGETILLSEAPSDNDKIARRASVASAITAGASEALRVASHGHDKGADH